MHTFDHPVVRLWKPIVPLEPMWVVRLRSHVWKKAHALYLWSLQSTRIRQRRCSQTWSHRGESWFPYRVARKSMPRSMRKCLELHSQTLKRWHRQLDTESEATRRRVCIHFRRRTSFMRTFSLIFASVDERYASAVVATIEMKKECKLLNAISSTRTEVK